MIAASTLWWSWHLGSEPGLPKAQTELGMSDATRGWVITSYTLAFGGLLLLGGRLAALLGHNAFS